MSKELMPCPFCGRDAKTESARMIEDDGATQTIMEGFWAACVNPECAAHAQIVCPTREAAVRAWNTRTIEPPLPELAGKVPLVLYFETKADADSFATVIGMAMVNPVVVKLP